MVHRVGLGLVGAVAFRVGLGLVGVVAFRVGLGLVGVVAFRVGVGLGQVEGGGRREGRGSKGGCCNKTSSSLNYQTKRQFGVTASNLQNRQAHKRTAGIYVEFDHHTTFFTWNTTSDG